MLGDIKQILVDKKEYHIEEHNKHCCTRTAIIYFCRGKFDKCEYSITCHPYNLGD